MLWCESVLCDAFDAFAFVEHRVYLLAMWFMQPFTGLLRQGKDKENNSYNVSEQSWWLWGDFMFGNIALLLFCALLILVLKIAHPVLKSRWKTYSRLPSENRQLYVLANLSKATCLAVLFFSKIWINDVYDAFALDQWNSIGARRLMRIKHISALYVATDVVALWIVPKLPQTTVIHHYVAWLLAMIIFGTDVRTPQSNVVRMILLYGAWSTVPYAVNGFLALRRLYEDNVDDNGNATKTALEQGGENNSEQEAAKPAPKRVWLEALAIFALVLYAVTCACNWAWHLHWFIEQAARGVNNWYAPPYNASFRAFFVDPAASEWFPTIAIVLYSLSSVMLARDDIILMHWLWERALTNGCVQFIAQTLAMSRTVAWHACKSLYSRPLKHIVTEKTE